jgi:lysophospholipase L1-like esterase
LPKISFRKKDEASSMLIIIVSIIIVLFLVGFGLIYNYMGYSHSGNKRQFDVENVPIINYSPLEGKNIIFLGSSVTVGSCSGGVSFVQYLEKRDSIKVIEEAVSGTTLVTTSKNNYIDRMKNNLDKIASVDCFLCQLSTNDISFKKPLGKISDSMNVEDFDTKTITGAIEYIIGYAKKTWKCPVVFYTDTYYGNVKYKELVDRLLDIQKKWNIGVIDLLNNEKMKSIDKKKYNLYMANPIHPTKAGYLEWWTPVMEEYLYSFLE